MLLAASARGYGGLPFLDTPKPFISQPPFIPITDFSSGTVHLTIAGLYGYEKYRMPVMITFPVHRGGMHLALSGAFSGSLGWNVAAGISFPETAALKVSIRLGSCIVPASASLAWRFAGGPDQTSGSFVAGMTYAYSAVRGYFRLLLPGPPEYYYFIQTVALADVTGSVYGVFAGVRPMLVVAARVSLRPFILYRITFDATGFYYHIRAKILNDEAYKCALIAFKYRQLQDPERPVHEILVGLELNIYGVGFHVVVQFTPIRLRTMCQAGLSYTHAFSSGK